MKKLLETVSDSFDVWALGIALVISCNYMQWNQALVTGFGSLFVATAVTGGAFVLFNLCNCETFSGLPFSGGIYGLARCTLGFFPGYLIGCSETINFLINASFAVSTLTVSVCDIFGIPNLFQLFLSLLIFILVSCSYFLSASCFWKISSVLGVLSFMVTLVYCLGTLRWIDFHNNITGKYSFFEGGIKSFVTTSLPIASFFYIGIDALTFTCSIKANPRTSIPNGSVASIITLYIVSLWIVCVGCASSTNFDELSQEVLPLNTGFSLIFHSSAGTGTIISLPALIGTVYGFTFASGKLISALGESKLFPEILSAKLKSNNAPFLATCTASLISYLLTVLVYLFPQYGNSVYNVAMLSAYSTYITQCICYVLFRKKYSSIICSFKSPLGIAGAIFAGITFLLCAVSIGFLQNDNFGALISHIVLWGVFSIYYFAVAKNRQRFSDEEQKNLLVAHVINFNKRRANDRRRIRGKNHIQICVAPAHVEAQKENRKTVPE